MERKVAVPLFIIILIIFLCIANYYTNEENHEKIITLNEIDFKVPNSNYTVTNKTEHYSYYEDMQRGIKIHVFDSQATNLSDAYEMFSFIALRDTNQLEAMPVTVDNHTLNYSSSLNEYTYLKNNGDRSIFIITKDDKQLQKILESMTIRENANKNNTSDFSQKIIEYTVNYHPSFENNSK